MTLSDALYLRTARALAVLKRTRPNDWEGLLTEAIELLAAQPTTTPKTIEAL